MIEVKTKQELKNAILSGADEIKVDNPELERALLRIFAIKQYAWSAAIVLVGGGISAAIVIFAASAGAGSPVSTGLVMSTAGGAATIVGLPAATAMISLGIVMGGVAGLKTIREKYQVKSKEKGNLVLCKK